MKVCVTGGLGYIGSVLVPYLASQGHQVRVYDSMLFGNSIERTPSTHFFKGDIRDTDTLRAVMEGCDAVIHLAAVVTDELVDMNPEYARQVNEDATRDLCKLAVETKVKRLIYASSSSVYGSQEEPCTEESPTKPETAYAETKLWAEQICLSYSSKKMDVVAVRSATCCGPAPRMRLDTIVNVFSKQAYFDGVIAVHDGTQYRSNIHVRDVAELYELLLRFPKAKGEVFNAVREFDTADGIAQTVQGAGVTPKGIPAIYVDKSKRDTRQYRMLGWKAAKILNWVPTRSITKAVRDNYLWFTQGGVPDPNDALYYNTRRMKDVVTKA